MKRGLVFGLVFFLMGCANLSTYVKPQAPWDSIQRVAVLPFVIPSENPTRRQMVTQMFAMELRRSGLVEVTEVPLGALPGSVPSLEEVAKGYQVDAVFSGSVDYTQGTVVHVWLHDAATKEILWSGTYLVGVGSEFFSVRTPQQQLQRSIRRLILEFSRNRV
jgi:TolB-like protein